MSDPGTKTWTWTGKTDFEKIDDDIFPREILVFKEEPPPPCPIDTELFDELAYYDALMADES